MPSYKYCIECIYYFNDDTGDIEDCTMCQVCFGREKILCKYFEKAESVYEENNKKRNETVSRKWIDLRSKH